MRIILIDSRKIGVAGDDECGTPRNYIQAPGMGDVGLELFA